MYVGDPTLGVAVGAGATEEKTRLVKLTARAFCPQACCWEASLILKYIFQKRGLKADIWTCSVKHENGFCETHCVLVSDGVIYDATAFQFNGSQSPSEMEYSDCTDEEFKKTVYSSDVIDAILSVLNNGDITSEALENLISTGLGLL